MPVKFSDEKQRLVAKMTASPSLIGLFLALFKGDCQFAIKAVVVMLSRWLSLPPVPPEKKWSRPPQIGNAEPS